MFTGAISAIKLDMALLTELARSRPDWSLALVGPVGLGDPHTDVGALAAEPNVHLLGKRAYEELPGVLRGADAGLIPYVRSELTASIFPMKVYEYLAAGLPVVATPLPALEGVADVAVAADAAGFRDGSRPSWQRTAPGGVRSVRVRPSRIPGTPGCARSPRRSTRSPRRGGP